MTSSTSTSIHEQEGRRRDSSEVSSSNDAVPISRQNDDLKPEDEKQKQAVSENDGITAPGTNPTTYLDAAGVPAKTQGAKVNERDYDSVLEDEKAAEKFNKLSWPRLSVCLIVEAIALGALSLPQVFATLGMVAGVILTTGIGFIAIYTSDLVGRACLKYPGQIFHYSDLGYKMGGKWAREIVGVAFALQLTLVTGSHVITGSIALETLHGSRNVCAIVWAVVSGIILFILSLPTSFHDVAVLGYIDFVSICAAILSTMIFTGVQASQAPGGLSAANWHAFPQKAPTFADAFLAVTNIAFAYSFAICQPSFQAELKRPKDYKKAIWALGLTEIVIYVCTGAIIYAFVGDDVASPALSSGGRAGQITGYAIAIPVIYISGAINTTTAARFLHLRIFGKTRHRFISTKTGITAWVLINMGLTLLAWIIAEAIPFFSSFLGVVSALLISGFSFYLPALMWFLLLKEGKWYSRKNILSTIANAAIFLGGLTLLVAGMYSSITSIKNEYASGSVSKPYSCQSRA